MEPNKNPPMAPSQVLLGLIVGANFRVPISLPVKNENVSVTKTPNIIIANNSNPLISFRMSSNKKAGKPIYMIPTKVWREYENCCFSLKGRLNLCVQKTIICRKKFMIGMPTNPNIRISISATFRR